jgi:hypothetical protein
VSEPPLYQRFSSDRKQSFRLWSRPRRRDYLQLPSITETFWLVVKLVVATMSGQPSPFTSAVSID